MGNKHVMAFVFFSMFLPFVAAAEDVPADIMPLPTEQKIFLPYNSFSQPNKDTDPSFALPLGAGHVTMGGDTLSLQISAFQFSEKVDAYFGMYAPSIHPEVFLLNKNKGLQPLSQGLVKWKEAVNDISDPLFGDIPVSVLPVGEYLFYLMVTPADYTGDFADIPYYFWTAVVDVKLQAEDVANKAIAQFGNERDAAISVLLAADKGYALQQIVDAILINEIKINGDIIDSKGVTRTPENEPYNHIIIDIPLGSLESKTTEKVNLGLKNSGSVKVSQFYDSKTNEALWDLVTYFILVALELEIESDDYSATVPFIVGKVLLEITKTKIGTNSYTDFVLLIGKINTYFLLNKKSDESSFSENICPPSQKSSSLRAISLPEEQMICDLISSSQSVDPIFSGTQALTLAASNITSVYAALGIAQEGAVDTVQLELFRPPSGYMAADRFEFQEIFVHDISTTKIEIRGSTGYINDKKWGITEVKVKQSTVVEGWPSLNSSHTFTARNIPMLAYGESGYTFQITGEEVCSHISNLIGIYTPYYINTEYDYYCDRDSYIHIVFNAN